MKQPISSPAICHNSNNDNNNKMRITSVIKHSRHARSWAKCFSCTHHLTESSGQVPEQTATLDSYFTDEEMLSILHQVSDLHSPKVSNWYLTIISMTGSVSFPSSGTSANGTPHQEGVRRNEMPHPSSNGNKKSSHCQICQVFCTQDPDTQPNNSFPSPD